MTNVFNLQRILLSLGIIVFVGALVVGATGAFFNDTETSTGNTFAAGALDLRVDSTAHYNNMVCTDTNADGFGDQWKPEAGAFPGDVVPADHYPQPNTPCNGSWVESDLIADAVQFRFFNLTDVKPGDNGEDTISLHVYNNDAWGCFLVSNVQDLDVTCTEPESEDADDPSCTPGGIVGPGELGAKLTFDAWLDEGSIAGFQNINANGDPVDASAETGGLQKPDPEEGDNILNANEQLFWNDVKVDEASEGPFAIKNVLSAAYTAHTCSVATGANNYGPCQGLAADGRMVGSTTYYFGLAWNLPDTVGNEVQTDQLIADMTFQAEQHRNNPNFTCTPAAARTTLTLAKTVIPAQVEPDSSFTLTADGVVAADVISGIEGSPAVTLASVTPGDYDLSESGADPADGTPTVTWSCFIGLDPAVMPDADTVTVPAGEDVVCVVTNDYDD